MKFHELKPGKKYFAVTNVSSYNEVDTLEVRNGLLWFTNKNRYAKLTMDYVATLEFKEIPQYVTFEQAIEHMRKGGKARFQDSFQTYTIISELLFKGEVVSAFETVLMEPDWILL